MLLIGSKIAADNAARVLDRIEDERSGLVMLTDQLTLMDLAAGESQIKAEAKASVEKLREEVSYLTVSLRPTARQLETELMTRLCKMTNSLKEPTIDIEAFRKAVAECLEIIRVRRNQYYK